MEAAANHAKRKLTADFFRSDPEAETGFGYPWRPPQPPDTFPHNLLLISHECCNFPPCGSRDDICSGGFRKLFLSHSWPIGTLAWSSRERRRWALSQEVSQYKPAQRGCKVFVQSHLFCPAYLFFILFQNTVYKCGEMHIFGAVSQARVCFAFHDEEDTTAGSTYS